MTDFFTYRARCDRVIDGDTVDLELDCGFGISHRARVRLVGVDTHEVYGVPEESSEYQKGRVEAEFVSEWFDMAQMAYSGDDGWPLIATTLRDQTGKYGRYLAEIYRRDTGANLIDALKTEFPEVAD